jgi:signal peptidase II
MNSLQNRYRTLAVVVTVIVALDRLTKVWIQSTMRLHESITILPGLFNLTYIRNPGAAFGILSDLGEGIRLTFLISTSVLAVGLLVFLFHNAPMNGRLLPWAILLILGGAVGNFIDRVRYGEVVDFLDFYFRSYHWPAFNLADSCITIGVCLLILHYLRSHEPARTEP